MIEKSKFRVLITYPNLNMMLTPSSAVGIFTTILKEQGYSLDFFDCTPYDTNLEFLGESLPVTRATKLMNSRSFDSNALFGEPKKDLSGDYEKKIKEFKPHAIIFATLVEDTWPQVKELLKVIKNFPDISHIAGGVFCKSAPEMAIAENTMQCIGTDEGEEVIIEFCEAVRSGSRPTSIKGTWAKKKDGTVIKNAPRPLVDINKVIPDYSLFDEKRFLRPLGAKVWKAVSIETYRGCPYTCSFCNSPMKNEIAERDGQGSFLRRKNMETLRKEISSYVERYNAEFLYINDDAFMARPKKEILDFCEMHSEFKLPFWFQTRFENVDKVSLEALKKVGCYRISFGIEHGNLQYRKEKLFRNITNEMMLEKSKIVQEVGIPFTVNNLVGMPYETRDLLHESIDFIREMNCWDSLSINIFVPYHGTKLREMAINEGWLDPEKQTTSVIAESILEMPKPYLSAKEIFHLQKTIPLYTRFPRSRFNEIKMCEDDTKQAENIFKELSNEWYDMTYGLSEKDRMLTYQG
jgi:radical SAM superfamily enzyme YgiQ (UPF0313 family)